MPRHKKESAPPTTTDSVAAKPPSRISKVMASDIIKNINKSIGAKAIILASEKEARKICRIPSGIFPLDCALGGGWQTGHIHTCFGEQHGGKTSAIARTIGNAQKLCGNCYTGFYGTDPITGDVNKCECGDFREVIAAYIDVEGNLDLAWCRKLGMDPDRMVITTPEYAEQSIDILENLLRTGDYDIIALDSLAFLTPMKEIEISSAKETMGVQPRVIGKGIRKFVAALNAMEMSESHRRPTIFFTNQTRMKIGVMFGNPETLSGGKAPRFASVTEVRFTSGKYFIPEEGIGKPLYAEMGFKVEKNKTAVPKTEGSYKLILSEYGGKHLGDVADEDVFIDTAEKIGVLTGGGKFYKLFGENCDSKSELKEKLVTDVAYRKKAYERLMNIWIKV